MKNFIKTHLLSVIFVFFSLTILSSSTIAADDQPLLLGIHDNGDSLVVTLYNPYSGEQFPIDTISDYNLTNTDIVWSPDGKHVQILAYPVGDTSRLFLKLFSPDTNTLYTLSEHVRPGSCYTTVQWSPDGRYLAYIDYEAGISTIFNLSLFDTETHESQYLATIDTHEFFPNSVTYGAELHWISGGTALDFRAYTKDGDIHQSWSISGEQLEPVVGNDYRQSSYRPFRASLSPDRHYVVIQQETETRVFDLKHWKLLDVKLPTGIMSVEWSMDTGHLVFQWQGERYSKLSVLNLNTQRLYDLTPDISSLSGINGGKWGIKEQHVYAQIQLSGDDYPRLSVWSLVDNQWIYRSEYNVHHMIEDWFDDRYIAYTVKDIGHEGIAGFYLMDVETWQSTMIFQYDYQPEIYRILPSSDQTHFAVYAIDYLESFSYSEKVHIADATTFTAIQLPGEFSMDGAWIWRTGQQWSPSGRYFYALEGYDTPTIIADVLANEIYSYPYIAQWDIAFSPDETYFVMQDRAYYPDMDDAYLLELETQEYHLFEDTRFMGWQGGGQDSLLICGEG